MRKYSVFIDWKNKCCQNAYTSQSSLQIQSNLFQNPRLINWSLKFIGMCKGSRIAKIIFRKKKSEDSHLVILELTEVIKIRYWSKDRL